MKRLVVGILTCSMMILLVMSTNVSAVDLGNPETYAPPPLGISSSTDVVNPASAARTDNIYSTLPASYAGYIDSWHFHGTYGFTGEYPPDNCTVQTVYVMAVVGASAATDLSFYYSVTDGSLVWEGPHTVSSGTGMGNTLLWDVTSLEAWNTTTDEKLILNNFVHVKVVRANTAATVYCDYLGFYYNWTYPGTVTPPPEEFEPQGSWLMQLFTLVIAGSGFIAMIVYPAMFIKYRRMGDDKIGGFVGFVIMESVFIGMFYAGLAISSITG